MTMSDFGIPICRHDYQAVSYKSQTKCFQFTFASKKLKFLVAQTSAAHYERMTVSRILLV